MCKQRVFFNKSYQADGKDIHLLALEKRQDCERLLLAFPFESLPYWEDEQLTVREMKKQELSMDESYGYYTMPHSIAVDGKEINFVGSNITHITREYKDEVTHALYEYLLKQEVLPESLIATPMAFGFCKTEGNQIHSLNFQHMVLHFPPKKKTYLVEQSFHGAIKGKEQTLCFSVDGKETHIYVEGLRLIDLFEGRSEEEKEHLKGFFSEEHRLLVVAYENSDERLYPMFYRKDFLDNPMEYSNSATGWFVSPEKGTVGSHGLPLRYAYIEKVSEQFDEDMEIELFSVQINVPKQENVEVMSDCIL